MAAILGDENVDVPVFAIRRNHPIGVFESQVNVLRAQRKRDDRIIINLGKRQNGPKEFTEEPGMALTPHLMDNGLGKENFYPGRGCGDKVQELDTIRLAWGAKTEDKFIGVEDDS